MSNKRPIRRFNILEEVYKSSIKFLSPLSVEQTYKVFIDEAMNLVEGKYGSVLLLKKGVMHRVYSSNLILNSIKPRHKGYTYKTATSGKFKVLKMNQLEKIHPELKKAKIKYDIIIPLMNKNKSIGVFTILSNNKFTKKQIDLLLLFSPLATLAIRKAQLYDEVNKAIETRDLFISLASHELRTPITTSYIYLQLIQRNYINNKPFDSTWVLTLLNEMERLSAIINELLEVNQIRTGKLSYNWQECDIEEIIQRALTNFKAKYRENKIRSTFKLNKKYKKIIGDRNKLIGVIYNLLDNAAKHSSPDETISISLEFSKPTIILKIKDKGIGIPEKDMDKIFNDFYKVAGNTKPGMGLGLFLAKQIIEKHRGDISIKSKLGKGTEVQIKLPVLKHD